MTPPLWQKVKKNLSLLMVLKEESEKPGLKLNIQKTKIMTFSLITSWRIDGETMKTVRDFIFLGFKISVDGDCSHEIKRCLLLGSKVMTILDSILKSRDITLLTKVHLAKGLVSPVVMLWELDHKENWGLKNWCFWTVVLYMAIESPLDYKEIQLVHPKETQSWIFIGRTDAEAETPIFWWPDVKNWLTGQYLDAGKDWRQEEKGVDRGWDGWMASLTWRTWVWESSASWIGKPGVLQSMGSQRVRHNWVSERKSTQAAMKNNTYALEK